MDYSTQYLQRLQLLTGIEGIKKLKAASVAVIGLGGVGSHAAEALARCGIGNMTLVDMDRIEESNLNRQLPALTSTIGRYKTDIAAERIKDINPQINICKFTCRYEPVTSEKILTADLDYVIDAIDSISDKTHLIKTCLCKGLPIVSSMGMANRLNPLMLKIGDINETSVCPVARRLRKELRNQGINTGVPVVYSIEAPLKTFNDNEGSLGSIIYLPGIAGYLLASLIVQRILE
ncbi:MAG TPA: tRNA threonylcarbamoyladenosine dehydratase [Syntrophomonadaceae bacterium]|nr:tRNA threonylcarbamoyladenosine dehydratase [Syntrophomonadaceae bacterium]HNX28449.1 tRNA threonylcarbamoyladenosine dehydratase [Syntrophomonadaceae bacterium]HPR93117.1 tRNA threonylcarbamoyladenosine dehydratase [Syntrophomonadaceae bacterium]